MEKFSVIIFINNVVIFVQKAANSNRAGFCKIEMYGIFVLIQKIETKKMRSRILKNTLT